ncbi:M16 family metallopeptidase [Agaribacter marinus]|uniref:Zinc protease n=1 Tax=Agaribacter marinus TaxID=1431249 RepID=A0AA37WK22_9ALTE|nr:insulinase family protein [Agaribacter marinus]GLR72678.1 zinc protease [Agaribacter marinus]
MRKTLLRSMVFLPVSIALLSCTSSHVKTIPDEVDASSESANTAPFVGRIPLAPEIVKGELSNGIKYIIRQNAKPEKRAEIRLVINAGSILEDESQLGFAHFAEHMAFNGTEDFKKQEIVEYVESIGMRFGAHLNAYTSFDETVYQLQLPTDDPKTLETGIHILENWAHKITFDAGEIDKERGVVIEEMRTRQGANNRIMHKQLPVLYPDSQYAKRLPIGTQDILANGKHEDLIRFYKDWYRPDLMSLVAVGDFNVDEVEVLFDKYFSKIQGPTNPKPRIEYGITDNVEPLVSIETDPELVRTIVSVSTKHPAFEPATYAEQRQALVHQLFIGMLNNRYAELVLKPESPMIGGGANFNRSFGDKSMFSVGAAAKPGQVKESLAVLLTEINRSVEFGFSESEFLRQKAGIQNRYSQAAKEAAKIESARFTNEYVRHFTRDEVIPGIVHEDEITQHFLPTITLDEVNQMGKKWLTQKNRLISISAPDSQQASLPNESDVFAIWRAVDAKTLTAYEEVEIADSLMEELPIPGKVVSKEYIESIDSHIWTLSNGAKVVLKQTDFKEDSIVFSARSQGGTSLLEDDEAKQTFMASTVANVMGVGDFSVIDFGKFMQGKSFRLNANIAGRHQELKGESAVKDLEYFMQVLHLSFQTPRKDQEAFDTLIARAAPYYDNLLISPQSVFNEAMRKASYGDEPRSFQMTGEVVKGMDFEKSLAFFDERFSNASNFNFIFVGNIDFVQMEQLLAQYVASLPSEDERETWVKRPDRRKKGELSLTVKKGLEPKANVVMKLFGEKTWSHREAAKFKSLEGVLKTILRERIREEKSGVYGVGVGGGLSREDDKYSLSISFSCDPARVDELIAEIKQVFDEIKASPVAAKYVENYVSQQLKSREVAKKRNGFWLNHLTWLVEPGNIPQSIEEYDVLLQEMSPELVQETAQYVLDFEDSITAILLPETTE